MPSGALVLAVQDREEQSGRHLRRTARLAGGFPLYELVAADTVIAVASRDARTSWIRRALEL
ncbi:hypothetical protein AB0A81_35675 [Streptomyces flaveolus]|uniref:Uncharacterized protein n=1 Tax=Streptomyces flaveolus TaxID=67297 RepID=A0ABV1VSM8_9ACTN